MLGLGSLVEVDVEVDTVFGVIRWIGHKSASNQELVVGVELEVPWTDRRLKLNLSDGVYNGKRYFRCPERRAIFVSPKSCTKDKRFLDDPESQASIRSSTPSEGKAFGADCPIIEGSVPALSK